jgi:hypothetical protein
VQGWSLQVIIIWSYGQCVPAMAKVKAELLHPAAQPADNDIIHGW